MKTYHRLHNVAIALVLLTVPITSLAMSAEAAHPLLRVTPFAQATPEQLTLLGREPIPFENDGSIFVQWSAMPDAIFQIRCPEGIVGLDSPYKKFLYVRGQRWQSDGPDGWLIGNLISARSFTGKVTEKAGSLGRHGGPGNLLACSVGGRGIE